MAVFHKFATTSSLLPAVRALRSFWRERGERPRSRALAETLVRGLSAHVAAEGAGSWQVQRFAPTVGDITVMMLGPACGGPAAVVKLARSEAAARNLRRYRGVVEALSGDARLPEQWRALLPRVLSAGETGGRAYLLESMLPGAPLASAAGGAGLGRAQRAAAEAIALLHRSTVAAARPSSQVRRRLLDDRLRVVERALARRPGGPRFGPALARLGAELRDELVGGPIALSWVHGDFAPDNILAAPGGAPITGVIDWELAAAEDMPILDTAHLLLSCRLKVEGGELGPLVDSVVRGAGWRAPEAALLEEALRGLPGRRPGLRAIALLCWLRHVSDTLCKATRYARSRFWLAANVEHVLARL